MELIRKQRLVVEDAEILTDRLIRTLAKDVAADLKDLADGDGQETRIVVTIEVYE